VTERLEVSRDPLRPSRLLRAEHDSLLPILRNTPEEAFARPTACPGWSVRDVLAHCAAALSRVTAGTVHAFTPELNGIDVAERRQRPLPEILSELASGYLEAGNGIAKAGGRLDVIALGEWIHGGDVRAALGEQLAYESAGFDDACVLLSDWTRRRAIPLVQVRLGDAALTIGAPMPGRATATLRTSRSALIKLVAGRQTHAAEYHLTGARASELIVF
jgi:uncharacterized protein (TIGR03083 family)